MNYERILYTTADKSLTVDFYFLNSIPNAGWRIYIMSTIDYKDRNIDPIPLHRIYDAENKYDYICWDHPIETLEDARYIARLYAEITTIYIQFGGSFDEIAQQYMASMNGGAS